MVWLPGLERLWGGVYVVVIVFTCCIVCFMPGQAFVVGRYFLGSLPSCEEFDGPLNCLSVFTVVGGMRIVEAWKVASDCLPPKQIFHDGLSVWGRCELYCT